VLEASRPYLLHAMQENFIRDQLSLGYQSSATFRRAVRYAESHDVPPEILQGPRSFRRIIFVSSAVGKEFLKLRRIKNRTTMQRAMPYTFYGTWQWYINIGYPPREQIDDEDTGESKTNPYFILCRHFLFHEILHHLLGYADPVIDRHISMPELISIRNEIRPHFDIRPNNISQDEIKQLQKIAYRERKEDLKDNIHTWFGNYIKERNSRMRTKTVKNQLIKERLRGGGGAVNCIRRVSRGDCRSEDISIAEETRNNCSQECETTRVNEQYKYDSNLIRIPIGSSETDLTNNRQSSSSSSSSSSASLKVSKKKKIICGRTK